MALLHKQSLSLDTDAIFHPKYVGLSERKKKLTLYIKCAQPFFLLPYAVKSEKTMLCNQIHGVAVSVTTFGRLVVGICGKSTLNSQGLIPIGL